MFKEDSDIFLGVIFGNLRVKIKGLKKLSFFMLDEQQVLFELECQKMLQRKQLLINLIAVIAFAFYNCSRLS